MKPPRRVLEVGCGSGHWLALLAASGHRVAGIDASSGMRAKAKSKVQTATRLHGQAETLPLENSSFERVIIFSALQLPALPHGKRGTD